MSRWRLIITDSESLSGVAPECPNQGDVTKRSTGTGYMTEVDAAGVYDCCPQPHLECGSEPSARRVMDVLNYFRVEVCS